MSDWRERAEQIARRRAEKDAEINAKKQEKIKRDVARREQMRRDANESEKAIYGRRFKCHVCKRPSTGPTITEVAEMQPSIDMNNPVDRTRCRSRNCGKWTCDECLHNGICRKCARG